MASLLETTDAHLLQIAGTRLSMLLHSHVCTEHGDGPCSDRITASAVVEEVFRRYPSTPTRR